MCLTFRQKYATVVAMDTAQAASPWWHILPAAIFNDATDACGTCGISRDRHEVVGCPTPGDWRILAYVGTYDRIPDGKWNVALGDGPAEDWRDPDGRGIWWIAKETDDAEDEED